MVEVGTEWSGKTERELVYSLYLELECGAWVLGGTLLPCTRLP